MSLLILGTNNGTYVPPTVPTVVQGLGLAPDDTLIDATWSAPSDDGGSPITGYVLRWQEGSGSFTTVNLGVVLSYQITSLTNDILHTVEVAAVNSVGTGPYASATATPAAIGAMPAKPVPNLDTTGAITLTPSSNVQSVIDANPNGTVFYIPNGTYNNFRLIRPKEGNRFIGESEAGVNMRGDSNSMVAFRVRNANVTIARMNFENYQVGDIDQNNAVINLKDNLSNNKGDDENGALGLYHLADDLKAQDTHIAECTFADNGALGIFLGIRTIVTDCSFFRQSPHGLGGGGGVGGMIHSNYFEECGTSGAGGAGANNAQIKIAWWNIGPDGDSARDKAIHYSSTGNPPSTFHEPTETLKVVNNTFDGLNNPNSQRGLWLDLDVRDIEVCYNTFQNQNGGALFYEGCNNGWNHHNTYTNCGNAGAISFTGGMNGTNDNKYMSYGAFTTGASHNILTENETFTDCNATCINFNGARYDADSDWRTTFPVINQGRMASGFGPIGPTDRSNGGSSTCTVRNNTFVGSCNYFGVWFNADVNEATEGNLGTFVWENNTYPAGANEFIWGKTKFTRANWIAAGR